MRAFLDISLTRMTKMTGTSRMTGMSRMAGMTRDDWDDKG